MQLCEERLHSDSEEFLKTRLRGFACAASDEVSPITGAHAPIGVALSQSSV
jgi:hypothetical protein